MSDDIKRAEKKMAIGRMFVTKNECFFATIMFSFIYQMMEKGTMATDGARLWWSWVFVNTCTVAKVTFVLMHEILHKVFKHHLRRGNRDPKLWNKAGDYVINLILVLVGLTRSYPDDVVRNSSREWLMTHAVKDEAYRMPEDGLLDPRFVGMSTEEVYDILDAEKKSKPKPENKPGEGEGSGSGSGDETSPDNTEGEGEGEDEDEDDCPWGHVEDAVNEETGEALTPDELAEAEKEIAQTISVATGIARNRGQMPGALASAIIAADKPSIDWQEEMRETVVDYFPDDFSFAKQNRRYLGGELVIPALDGEQRGHACIMTDASGSVTQTEFSQFMGDSLYICREMGFEQVTLIQFDWTACEPEELEAGEEPEMIRRRTGGTRFRAPFDKADDLDILDTFDLIIVFTDGGDDQYPNEPDCPVIWATTGEFWGGPPPFGHVIKVKL